MMETPQSRYDKANRVSVLLKLNRKTDTDILSWLSRQESKQGAIKALIRAQIAKEQREP